MGSFLSSIFDFVAENKSGIVAAASLVWGAVNHFGHKKTKKALDAHTATQAGHGAGISAVAGKVMSEAEMQALTNEMSRVANETSDFLNKPKKVKK